MPISNGFYIVKRRARLNQNNFLGDDSKWYSKGIAGVHTYIYPGALHENHADILNSTSKMLKFNSISIGYRHFAEIGNSWWAELATLADGPECIRTINTRNGVITVPAALLSSKYYRTNPASEIHKMCWRTIQ
jgi:hypothetical protein